MEPGDLRLQVERLSAKSDSFSLPAWRKWARMTTDARHEQGWPTVFADGRGTASARASIYSGAAGGAHLRGLYADFLDEASVLLGRELPSAAWRPPRGRRSSTPRWTVHEAGEMPALGELVSAVYEVEVTALEQLTR